LTNWIDGRSNKNTVNTTKESSDEEYEESVNICYQCSRSSEDTASRHLYFQQIWLSEGTSVTASEMFNMTAAAAFKCMNYFQVMIPPISFDSIL
jgi:hypothetical protein